MWIIIIPVLHARTALFQQPAGQHENFRFGRSFAGQPAKQQPTALVDKRLVFNTPSVVPLGDREPAISLTRRAIMVLVYTILQYSNGTAHTALRSNDGYIH